MPSVKVQKDRWKKVDNKIRQRHTIHIEGNRDIHVKRRDNS